MGNPPPLMGYNTNARHKGKLYHIQTEDSGVKRPHIVTHLFADGGRILVTRKTTYAEHIENPNYREIVKKMMREQHKAVFIELRDGVHVEDGADAGDSTKAATTTPAVLDGLAADISGKREGHLGMFLDTKYVIDPESTEARTKKPFGSELLSSGELDEIIIKYLTNEL